MVKKVKSQRLKVKSKDGRSDLEDKVRELEDNWKRAVADYQNLKKRAEKERREFASYANQRLIEALLPIYDALKSAVEHARDKDGVRLILNQLEKLFENEGVKSIKVGKGDKFNPEIMEAIETKKSDDKHNIVAKVLRNGFIYKNKVLRAAEVKVYV
jgi:molecular chaperone GrpE